MRDEGSRAVASLRARLWAQTEMRWLANASLSRLAGGTDARSWRATLGQGQWYVRCETGDRRGLGADLETEARMLRIAGAVGIAPRLVHAAPAAGLVVTEYLEAEPWSEADYADPASLRRLGAQLARLHALPVDAALRRVDFALQARQLEARVQALGVADWQERREPVQAAMRMLAATVRPLVPCHNDLHPGNLLGRGALPWIVDWEYAGLGDPLFDFVPAWERAGQGGLECLIAGYGPRAANWLGPMAEAAQVYAYVGWLWGQAGGSAVPANPRASDCA